MGHIFTLVMAFAFLSCRMTENSISTPNRLKEFVLGTWTDDTSGTIKMEIRKADIYYPWMPAKFPYKIVGDTIELTRVDGTYIGPINWSAKAILKNDTLLIFEQWGVEKYWRVKPNK
jgi:hypothetical protein